MSATPPTPDPLLGSVLGGKYRIERVVGKGGTGRVYQGRQDPIGRLVAVKVMRPGLDPQGQQRFEERFFREASLAGALQHPNVVTVHDFGREAGGDCYIVMELLGGRSLKQLLREGPVDPERTLRIFEQVARGLRHAHRAGLVHRDIKPGNIQIIPAEDGADFVKIMDFGLVKVTGSAADDAELSVDLPDGMESAELTRAGTFIGTPHYTAPEQARGKGADARTDLYSLGVMMYRALTGVLPYYDKDPMQIAVAHVRHPYPPMAERAPDVTVPAELEAIVRRCMQKDPDRRYPDAGALLVDLVAVRRALYSDAPSIEAGTIEASHVEPPRRAPRWPVAVLALVLLGVAGVAGVGWWSRTHAPPPPVAEDAAVDQVVFQPADAVVDVPPAPRVVTILLSSDPSGAQVLRDGEPFGETPVARTVDAELDAPPLHLVLHRRGYHDAEVDLAMDQDQAVANVILTPIKRHRSRAPAAAPVVVDGVGLDAAQAARALAFVNSSDRAALKAAGVAGRQAGIIVDGQPWSDLQALGATAYIGPKTIQAIKLAAAP